MYGQCLCTVSGTVVRWHMYCKKCGKEIEQGCNFCEFCGEPINGEMIPDSNTNKKRIAVVLICISVLLILGIIVASVFISSKKTAEYNVKMDSADRYIQGIEYSKAEAAYLEAVKIKPKEEKAYIKLSKLYISQGKYDEAGEILKQGKDNIGRKASSEFEQLYDEVINGKTSPQYQAYYELCQKRLKQYGRGNYEYYEYEFVEDAEYVFLQGLILAKLFDFNNDNNYELILAYSDETVEDLSEEYKFEVWAWQDDKLVNIMPETIANHGSSVGHWLNTAVKNDITYLNTSIYEGDNWFCRYMKYEDGDFTTEYESDVKFYYLDEEQEDVKYYVNGEEVSMEEQDELVKDFPENRNMEDRDVTVLNPADSGEFEVYFNGIYEDYAEKVLAETERTLKLLKGSPGTGNKEDVYEVLKDLPTFICTSGVGNSSIEIEIDDNGTFRGESSDLNMGEYGEDYPNGTIYTCKFNGKFTDIKKIDDFTYSMKMEEFSTEGMEGDEYISGDIKYIITEPYGMKKGEIYHLYLPGIEMDMLPLDYYEWISMVLYELEGEEQLPIYGLYNTEEDVSYFEKDYL